METKILKKLENIENMISDQSLITKDVINFREACRYLDFSASHLYKLTSQKRIPHFCPEGKRLYFNRLQLVQWLQRNPQTTADEIEQAAADYMINTEG